MKLPKFITQWLALTMFLPAFVSSAANWSIPTSGSIDATPVLAPGGGAIYITAGNSGSGQLYSINPDTSVNWTYPDQPGEILAGPAIGPDGTVYATSAGGVLLAVPPAGGSATWSHTVGGAADTVPAVGADGTIYVTVNDTAYDTYDGLFAVNPDGTPQWNFYLDASSDYQAEPQSSPAIGPDGTIYFRTGSSDGGRLYAVSSSGSQEWVCQIPCQDEVDVPPAVGPDGTIYVTGADGYLYAINPADGSQIWSLYIGASDSSPSMDPNGKTVLYVGNEMGQVFAIDYNHPGDTSLPIYTVPGNGAIESTPAIAPDGTIYVTSMDGNLYALQIQPNGTAALKWHFSTDAPGGSIHSSPVIGPDGMIYFGCEDGSFYAVDPSAMQAAMGLIAFPCNGQVTLTWNAQTGATSYNIKRSTVSGQETFLQSTTATDLHGHLGAGWHDLLLRRFGGFSGG
jgi:outer membrane protein assembly factor BamB